MTEQMRMGFIGKPLMARVNDIRNEIVANPPQKEGVYSTGMPGSRGSYQYFTYEQILSLINPFLVKHGVSIYFGDLEYIPLAEVGSMHTHVIVKGYACVASTDNSDDKREIPIMGEAGDSGDKAVAKAKTSARKAFLCGLFAIADGYDPDGADDITVDLTTGPLTKRTETAKNVLDDHKAVAGPPMARGGYVPAGTPQNLKMDQATSEIEEKESPESIAERTRKLQLDAELRWEKEHENEVKDKPKRIRRTQEQIKADNEAKANAGKPPIDLPESPAVAPLATAEPQHASATPPTPPKAPESPANNAQKKWEPQPMEQEPKKEPVPSAPQTPLTVNPPVPAASPATKPTEPPKTTPPAPAEKPTTRTDNNQFAPATDAQCRMIEQIHAQLARDQLLSADEYAHEMSEYPNARKDKKKASEYIQFWSIRL